MLDTIVIAAAGRGTRMKHLSEKRPKHLIPVAGHPFFYYVLESIKRNNFKNIVVVVGHMAEQMEEFLSEYDSNITVVNQFDTCPDKYGTAVVVEAAKEVVGDNPFVFVNGDNLYHDEVLQCIAENDGNHHIAGMYHPNPSQYGVLESTEEHHLTQIVEKPEEPLCNVINVGVYSFQPSIFSAIDTIDQSARGEYEITDAINVAAQSETVIVDMIEEGSWLDFGKPEDVRAVEKHILDLES